MEWAPATTVAGPLPRCTPTSARLWPPIRHGTDSAQPTSALADDGNPLWHELLVALRPNVVVLSIAESHLESISFKQLGRWRCLHSFGRKSDGTLRKRAYTARSCRYLVGTERALFVFCPAAQTPLGSITAEQRRELGGVLADAQQDNT